VSDDIFDKLDSLMHKHRAEGVDRKEQEAPKDAGTAEDLPLLVDEVPSEALVTAPIPVLTEIVGEGLQPEVEGIVLAEDSPILEPEPATEMVLGTAALDVAVAPSPEIATDAPPPTEASEPLADLERQLMEAVENRIAPRLASRLDLALGELLDQFRGEIERMVKDAVASELQQYLDTLGDDRRSPR
jgi:hypothetical protein